MSSSFNKICPHFIKYIETTTNLCVYKFGTEILPHNLRFLNVNTLTLINCNKFGTNMLLSPSVFPSVERINYISGNPAEFNICKRFPTSVLWKFPNKNVDFYDYVIQQGNGLKDERLFHKYISKNTIVNERDDFTISLQCDLQIPFFGAVEGEWWNSQFSSYLHLVNQKNTQEYEESILQAEIYKQIDFYNGRVALKFKTDCCGNSCAACEYVI